MIAASRFYARQGNESRLWYSWHDRGVSSSIVAKAATPSGFKSVMDGGFHIPPNEYMQFGTAMEPVLMDWAKRECDAIPNDWLILDRDEPLFGATPDGLSPDHSLIVECKTTMDPWDGAEDGDMKKVPITYRRQIQWQLRITGAKLAVLVWTLTERSGEGQLYTPWLDPRSVLIYPDEEMQADLVEAGRKVLDARSNF